MTPKSSILVKGLLTVVFIAIFTYLPAQNESKAASWEKKHDFMPSASLAIIHYSDFATSPLSYLGAGLNSSAAWQWKTIKRENLLSIDFLSGVAMANAPISEYYQTSSSATVMGLTLSNRHLFRVFKSELPEFLHLNIGGALLSSTYFRSNPDLQNNANGIESLFNIMMSGKAVVDVSRKEGWTLDLIIVERYFKPVERFLSYGFNLGLINMNYRPGYAYNSDADINGSDTNIIGYLLDSHQWTVNGWRMNSCLEYTQYKPNGNGFKWAYIWDAAYAPGRFESFQIATHSIRYTLIVNFK